MDWTTTNDFRNLVKGQKIMVETGSEIVVGTFVACINNYQFVEIDEAFEMKTGFTYRQAQMVPVLSISFLAVLEDDEKAQSKVNEQKGEVDDAKAGLKEDVVITTVNLTKPILDHIKQQAMERSFIVNCDRNYFKAIADIKIQTTISLYIEPFKGGRHTRISVLAVATQSAVYIFDMISIGKIFSEFKMILESNEIHKVVHYSHHIRDQLKHFYDIELRGVFDISVLYSVVTKSKCPFELPKILPAVFNLPSSYFMPFSDSQCKFDSYRRPIADTYVDIIAKIAIFQLKLQEFLLHKYVLANFYKHCDEVSRKFTDQEDSCDVALDMFKEFNAF